MIIDDEYKGMKDKYFEQAQTKTGVLSGVVKGLNDFVNKYDTAKQTMNSAMKELKDTYKPSSNLFDLKHMEIYNTFNDTVAQIREESRMQIHEIIQQVRDKVSDIIASDPSDGAMISDITMIKGLVGKLSDDEIKVFLDKYKHNYLATKVIFDAMTDEQAERIGVEFLTLKDIFNSLNYIETNALNLVSTYNGKISYGVAVMLGGSEIQIVNDAFESFVSTYEG